MIRLVVTLLLLLWTVPVEAQRSLVIERFDAAITVNRDGTIDVTETITPRFTGSWNGIFRTIPVVYRTPQGFNWTIRMDLIGVTDGSGQQLRVEANRERHYVKYKIWGARRHEHDAYGRPQVQGQERAPILRRTRRVVLERDR